LKVKKGEKLTEDDLDFLCSVYGTSVEEEGELMHNTVTLRPFEIRLFARVTDLRHQTPTENIVQV
jgi:hypothetical protein